MSNSGLQQTPNRTAIDSCVSTQVIMQTPTLRGLRVRSTHRIFSGRYCNRPANGVIARRQ